MVQWTMKRKYITMHRDSMWAVSKNSNIITTGNVWCQKQLVVWLMIVKCSESAHFCTDIASILKCTCTREMYVGPEFYLNDRTFQTISWTWWGWAVRPNMIEIARCLPVTPPPPPSAMHDHWWSIPNWAHLDRTRPPGPTLSLNVIIIPQRK